ncbi:MAG: type IV toxin-antitoxin system AbiEi family antitoxin domain-containing protein [Acidimicrobiales bacterium]
MEIFEIMAAQYGLVTRQQAFNAGLSRHQIEHRVKVGEWQREGRAVYRHAATAPSWRGGLLAACLASGGVASHRSAAAMWGLDTFWSPRHEITVPYGHRPGPVEATVHYSTQWDRIDRCDKALIPCTGIERVILDLGAVVTLRKLELAAESALRKKLLVWPDLRSCLIRHSIQGRDGCGRLRQLLELRYGDDELPRSTWSRLVANILSDAGLPTPNLEFRICHDNGLFIAEVDLAWPDQLLVVELDSVRWHLNRKSFEQDRRKRNQLRLLGWNVLELTWEMTIGDRRGLVQLVRTALDKQSRRG